MGQLGGPKSKRPRIDLAAVELQVNQVLATNANAYDKQELIYRVVADCPKVICVIHGKSIPALFDSGSQCSLVKSSYYERELKSADNIYSGGEKHFILKSASRNTMPLTDCAAIDITLFGYTVKGAGLLVTRDSHPFPTDDDGHSKPVTIGWNVIKLAYYQMCATYGDSIFLECRCPQGISSILFAQCLIYHRQLQEKILSEGLRLYDATQQLYQSEAKKKLSPSFKETVSDGSDGKVGKVTLGDRRNPICVPAQSMLTVPGQCVTRHKGPVFIEESTNCNLPKGLVVNSCYTRRHRTKVPVILINNTDQNIWIRDRYYAAEAYDVDLVSCKVEAEVSPISTENGEILVNWVTVPTEDVLEQLLETVNTSASTASEGKDTQTKAPLPEWADKPDTSSPSFDFKAELERLPFKFNIGAVELDREQQCRLIDLIYSHKDVFSLGDGDLGQCDALFHTIPTTTDKPIYLPHRTVPFHLQEEVRKCLNTWFDQGIIRPSKSPYASQVVIVRKKTGEIRLCVDYRQLNGVTVRDAFPLPRIDEALQAVQKAKVFCSIDLAQGYLQVAMDPEDMHKTAFRAGSGGLYEFTRMPFGLSNAGATFCRLMEMCLGDQQFLTLLLYLDDICIFAENVDQMLDRLELVFERLHSFKLKIKPKKSHFFETRVLFLGHELSQEGIRPNPEKVAKIEDWPTPTNRKELHSFLGLASYYRRFIKGFAKISKPLQTLLGATNGPKYTKKVPFTCQEWDNECQQAFSQLKFMLTHPPVLAYPDYSKPFRLETDASLKGLGAVLTQADEGGDARVIAYASRGLKPSERNMSNYSSSKLELLALKWAVTEKFKEYLWGSKFTVFTDNNPLAYIQKSKLGAAQIRWLSELALYDFDVKYRSGATNNVADALSRRDNPEEVDSEDEYDVLYSFSITADDVRSHIEQHIPGNIVCGSLKAAIQSQSIPGYAGHISDIETEISCHSIFTEAGQSTFPNQVTPAAMQSAQLADPILKQVIGHIKSGKRPTSRRLRRLAPSLRKYLVHWDRFTFKQGVLHRKIIMEDQTINQVVLPAKFRKGVFDMLHGGHGHQGIKRTMALFQSRVYWSSMVKDVTSWVQNCERCNMAKDYAGVNIKPSSIIAQNPMELLCIDFTVLDKSANGKENVLVMTDAFSKFSQAIVTNDQKARTVAKALVDHWFYVYGIPSRLHSDQGRSFNNQVIAELCKMYNIKQGFTTPYNPRGNAICERFNRTMHNLLATLPKDHKQQWPKFLPSLVFAYNSTPHTITGLQPYQLMFGRKASTPCDAWLGLDQYQEEVAKPKIEWLKQHQELLLAANKRAVKSIKLASAKRSSKGKSLSIPVGNIVYLRDHPLGRNKIQDAWKPETYVVVDEHTDPNVYYIRLQDGSGPVFPANRRQLRDLGSPATITAKDDHSQSKGNKTNIPNYCPIVKPKPAPRYNLRKRNTVNQSGLHGKILKEHPPDKSGTTIQLTRPIPAPRAGYVTKL